jgi:TPR repeat protein
MRKPSLNSFVLIMVSLLGLANYPVYALSTGGLKEKLQEELDNNPFLQQNQIRLKVIDEKNGYVTIQMYEGNRRLREAINKGSDIFSNKIDLERGSEGTNKKADQSLNALKKTLEYINKMDGVKAVLLTATVNTAQDEAEDLARKAVRICQEGKQDDCLKLLHEAAEQKSALAQYNLGIAYAMGDGVAQNYTTAVDWWRKAAEQGYVKAQRSLGGAYRLGKGVVQDYATAIDWWRKAAEQGDLQAQNNLAWLYATCKDPQWQNGKEALTYALKGISQDSPKWNDFDTLAAAYARNGQFQEAIAAQEKSIALLKKVKEYSKPEKKDKLSDAYEKLNLYKNYQAYVEK